jgi:hypothetical protein
MLSIPIILPLIRPLGPNLPHISFKHNPRIPLHNLLAILVMIHPLLAITRDDILTEETDGLVGNLTFAGALFDGLQEFHWIFGSA